MVLTSPLTVVEQVTRVRAACIPDWTQAFMAPGGPVAAEVASRALPAGVIEKWEGSLVSGDILRSSHRTLRSRGLWLRAGRDAEILAATLLQRHLLLDTVASGRFLTEDDFARSETPGEERIQRAYEVDLLVLTGVGDGYRSATGWLDASLQTLLRVRFDAGLPTLVCSTKRPARAMRMSPVFLSDAFVTVEFDGVALDEEDKDIRHDRRAR